MTKHRIHIWFAGLALAVLGISGCGGDGVLPEIKVAEPQLELSLHLSHDGQNIALNQSFIDEEGNNVKVVAFKCYMANIRLKGADSETLVSSMELFDAKPFDASISTPQWLDQYSFDMPEGVFERIEFGIGVPADLNQIDPSTYSNEDPLSTYSNMYWSWASMYRFIILEAKADTNGGENFDHDVIFHTGLDALYRSGIVREVDLSFTTGEKQSSALSVDWDDLFYHFDRIDLKKESSTHTTDNPTEFELAERFTDNFVQAISVQP